MMKPQLHIIKIGGNVIDDADQLKAFLMRFAAIKEPKILVHGGGKTATALAGKLGIKQTMVAGRRITDAETLDVTVMVYAGLVNKRIVSGLQALDCNAFGFCGADGNMIRSVKRTHAEIDFGFVGDVLPDGVNASLLQYFLKQGITPVVSPLTYDGQGLLLNTNADTMASCIAVAMSDRYEVSLTYCFEKPGVMTDINDDNSCLPFITQQDYEILKKDGIISDGMLPKLDNAFNALEKGVDSVIICHAGHISDKSKTHAGTVLQWKQ